MKIQFRIIDEALIAPLRRLLLRSQHDWIEGERRTLFISSRFFSGFIFLTIYGGRRLVLLRCFTEAQT